MYLNFNKLLSEKITIHHRTTQKLYDRLMHQLFVSYRHRKFHIVLQEETETLTVLQITYTQKFKAMIKMPQDQPALTSMPITVQESLSPITLQSLENFEFDETKICAIFDKMLSVSIQFDKLKWLWKVKAFYIFYTVGCTQTITK